MLRVIAFGLISTPCLIGSICTQYEYYRSGTTARLTPFSLTSVPHQVAPWNVGHGAANSLLAMPSSGSVPVESPQKPEPEPRFLALEGAMEQREATPRVPETIAIRYVSNSGSDANDGVSWGTAKHTIYGALISLPGGGSNQSGSGTVYVGPASAANPTANAGIWLMGSADPNFGSPPAGWLKCSACIVNIIGVPNFNSGPNSHTSRIQLTGGSGADANHPGLWLSAVGQPITIQNLFFGAGRGGVLGECSDHTRVNACGAVSETFINDGFGVVQSTTNGPALDITGYSYWLWFRDCGFSGNAYLATGGRFANNAAGMLMDGAGNNGQGLIYVTDANFASGGIKVIPGSLGVSSLYVTGAIEEGDFSHALPPLVWFTSFAGSMDSYLFNLNVADSGPPGTPTVQNDGGGPAGPTLLNINGSVQGPATVINPDQQTFSQQTVSPLLEGLQSGFFNGYMVGQTNVARRIAGLTPARFKNLAATDSTQWTTTGGTLTTGQTDPFGGADATKATTSGTDAVYLTGSCAAVPYAPTSGDWVVGGVWAKGVPATLQMPVFATCGNPAITYSNNYLGRAMQTGDGQWEWWWVARKVSANSSATSLSLAMYSRSDYTMTAYGPVEYIIPAGMLSDNEVLEFVSSMNSVDSSCQVGQICNVAGHPLVVSSYRTLSNCNSIASPAKCDSAPAGSFALGVGSTTASVNTTAVTANSQILVIEDSSLGAELGVTCNKKIGRTYMITDRAAGLSFTVSSSSAPTDHPACLSFQLLN